MSMIPFIDGIELARPALFDDRADSWITYGDLSALALEWAARLHGMRDLVFVYARNDIESVGALLGALAAGHAIALFDPNLPQTARTEIEAIYGPAWVVGPGHGELKALKKRIEPISSALSMLLSTSGSTGSAKLVRLGFSALQSNAEGIADVLEIGEGDVAAGHLPLHYSYGLSVLTSHLLMGASVRLTEASLTDRYFWKAMRAADVTHLPGVPFHYHIILKLGLERLDVPSLRTLTQAGGALAPELRRKAYDFMEERGGKFFVLYGQTEAAPRMTTLRHEDFLAAPESVGNPLPGCRIEVQAPDSLGYGEVVFHGPNVMLGYAESRVDLALGDELGGSLWTGDLGMLDEAGRLTLTGRAKRSCKLFGLRINLDEIESIANAVGPAAVTQSGDRLMIHVASTGDAAEDAVLTDAIMSRLRERLAVPLSSYKAQTVSALPRTERGKIDYFELEQLSEGAHRA